MRRNGQQVLLGSRNDAERGFSDIRGHRYFEPSTRLDQPRHPDPTRIAQKREEERTAGSREQHRSAIREAPIDGAEGLPEIITEEKTRVRRDEDPVTPGWIECDRSGREARELSPRLATV